MPFDAEKKQEKTLSFQAGKVWVAFALVTF